ncbi:hypothetical protein N9O95_04115 [Alphaproteobacteria bacterium]|nr:hypothetical protein [Alphaproteobacteria bacterium]
MKRIILHFGHDKTGTTSLQSTLFDNTNTLLNGGYFYPKLGMHFTHNRPSIIMFKNDIGDNRLFRLHHHINALWRLERVIYRQKFRKLLRELSFDHLIFSAEFLPNMQIEEYENILHFFQSEFSEARIEVYLYARHPVSYAESAWAQKSKDVEHKEETILIQDYLDLYERIKKSGLADSINLFRFEDGCDHARGPVHFLLEKMGMSDELISKLEINRKNDRMSLFAQELSSFVNTKIPVSPVNCFFDIVRNEERKAIFGLPGQRFQLTRIQVDKLWTAVTEQMEFLRETFEIDYGPNRNDKAENRILRLSEANLKDLLTIFDGFSPLYKKILLQYLESKVSTDELETPHVKATIEGLIAKEKFLHSCPFFLIFAYHFLTCFGRKKYGKTVVWRVLNYVYRNLYRPMGQNYRRSWQANRK